MLRIRLFGKFCVQRDEQIVDGFDAHKVQELFCYLLLHRDHALPRETLAGLLWPDTSTAQSKKSLRQVLWQLQSLLNTQSGADDERILLVEPEWVRLNPQAEIWLDVVQFEKAYDPVQRIPGHDLDVYSVQALEEAVQLYQGPLLEGWYEDWCLYERERLQSMYLAMLDKLMSYYEACRDYETSLAYGMRIMCYDRARERTHRRLMRLYYLLGDRAEALRQYERCAAALDEELGVSPSKATVALYKQIRADQLDEPSTLMLADLGVSPIITAPQLLEVLAYLTHLQDLLADLQKQVQQGIRALEQVVNSYN